MMPVSYVMLYRDVVNTSPSWLCTTGFLTQPLFLYYVVPLCQAKAIVAHRVIRSILQVQKTETVSSQYVQHGGQRATLGGAREHIKPRGQVAMVQHPSPGIS
jgi:hypothetical protein